MKNILITGGLGHIGSELIRKIGNEYNITIVDNLLTQRYCSLFDLKKDNINFIDKGFEELTIEDLNDINLVIHLGARTDAASSVKDKETTWDINVTKTEKFIDLLTESNVSHFIFPSSTSVYGTSKEEMFEDDKVLPQSPYAESKIAIENKLNSIDKSKLNYIIFRFGTIFGTSVGMRFHTAINKFCYQSAFNKKLTVWRENYEHFRPYLGLNDAIESIKLVIETDKENWNQTYNVLTNNYNLKTIVDYINEVKETEIEFVDTPLLNQHSYYINFDKIKNIGFNPTCDLKQTIRETINLLQ